jgi:hypothetical protein
MNQSSRALDAVLELPLSGYSNCSGHASLSSSEPAQPDVRRFSGGLRCDRPPTEGNAVADDERGVQNVGQALPLQCVRLASSRRL